MSLNIEPSGRALDQTARELSTPVLGAGGQGPPPFPPYSGDSRMTLAPKSVVVTLQQPCVLIRTHNVLPPIAL